MKSEFREDLGQPWAAMSRKKRIALKLGILATLVYITREFWGILILLIGYLAGYYESPRSDTPFLEAHQKAVKTFVESEDFGIRRFSKAELWNELSVMFENESYSQYQIYLIGLTPEKGDRYFESRIPRKQAVASAPYRKLTEEEAAAVAKMRAEKLPWVRVTPPQKEEDAAEGIHVMAPVYASTSCLECHQTKEGSLLGAFDYWLSH